MIKYKSNTYYILNNLLFIIILGGISVFLTYVLRDKRYLFIGSIVISLLFLFLILKQFSMIAKVEFHENNILIKYIFRKSEKQIAYLSIKEYQHIHGYKLTSLNIIKYWNYEKTDLKKIKITTVVSNNEFIKFVKWIKEKNNKIKFNFFPTDSKLIEEYEKEFIHKKIKT